MKTPLSTSLVGMTRVGMTRVGMTRVGMTRVGMTRVGMTLFGMTLFGMTLFGMTLAACGGGPTPTTAADTVGTGNVHDAGATEPDSQNTPGCTQDAECAHLTSICAATEGYCAEAGFCATRETGAEPMACGDCEICEQDHCAPLADGTACGSGSCLVGRICTAGVCGGGTTDCSDEACAQTAAACQSAECGVQVVGCGNTLSFKSPGPRAVAEYDAYLACAGAAEHFGGAEVKVDFAVPDGIDRIKVSLGEASAALGDTTLLVWAGNACIPNACVASVSAAESWTWTQDGLQAGRRYTFVVEPDPTAADPTDFTLTVQCNDETACVPYCSSDAACGGDGCGGTCGDPCPGEFVCLDAQCVDPGLPDRCEFATPIDATPFVYEGGTAWASDRYALGATAVCSGVAMGAGGRDVVYRITPEITGAYRFELVGAKTNFDGSVYVVTDCDAVSASCLGAQAAATADKVSLELSAGTTYYVIVDGGTEDGTYGLLVDAPPCEAAFDQHITQIPFSGTADPEQDRFAHAAGACGLDAFGAGLHDYVYAWTAPTDMTVSVSVTPTSGADLGLTVSTCLVAPISGCVAAANSGGVDTPETVAFDAKAGETYNIVVDGGGDTLSSALDFSLDMVGCELQCADKVCGDDSCGGECGPCADGTSCLLDGSACASGQTYDTCADAAVLTLGTPLQWTTVGGTDAMTPPASCASGFAANTLDSVATFTASVAGTYTFALTTTMAGGTTAGGATDGGGLYVVSDCASAGTSCLAGGLSVGSGGASVGTALSAGQTVWIISEVGVEGASYRLEVGLCNPNCVGAVCGDDGCGGTCGDCGLGQGCYLGACQTVDGDTCEAAIEVSGFVIGSTWISPPIVTSVGADDYANADAAGGAVCDVGDPSGAGQGAPDAVVRFVVPQSGTYVFRLTDKTDFDSALYILKGACDPVATHCVGGSQVPGVLGLETVEVPLLLKGDVIFIVIDGASAGQGGLAELSIEALP